ncbi:MAG: histidinol dehydrogenase [Collinsella sp.]
MPQEQIDAALEGLDPAFVAALEKAARQIREFHQREVEQSWFTTRPDGTMLGVKVTRLPRPASTCREARAVSLHCAHERHPRQGGGVKRVVMVTRRKKMA